MVDKINKEEYNQERFNSECSICKRTFYLLDIHHIGQNKENNLKENLLFVCKKCHGLIHHPYKKQMDYYKPKLLPNNYHKKRLLIKQFHSLLKSSQNDS